MRVKRRCSSRYSAPRMSQWPRRHHPPRLQPDSMQPQLGTVDFLTSIDSILRAHDYETLSLYLGEKTYYLAKLTRTKAWIRSDIINDQRTYAWCKTAPDLSTYKERTDGNGYMHQAFDEETWAQERKGRLHHARCRLGIVLDGAPGICSKNLVDM